MPHYDRGDPPQSTADVLRFLREELSRIEAYTHAPRTDGAWEDLRFPATAVNIAGPAKAPTWDTTNIGLAFEPSAVNDIQGIAQLPHSWREGTNIRPHIHWEAGTGFTAGRVVTWCLYMRWRNNGETTTALTAYTMSVTLTLSTTFVLRITNFPELTATGKNISSIIDFQLARITTQTAGTTATCNAILKEFDIHYLTDSFGSDKEFVKGQN